MTVELDTYVYQLVTGSADEIGVTWVTLTRRLVEAIDGETVTLSRAVSAIYPTHTPPATLDSIVWDLAADRTLTINAAQIGAGKAWEPSPDLGEAEVIDTEAVTAALLEHRNHRYVNREREMPAPVLSDEQAYLFHVAEWRELTW